MKIAVVTLYDVRDLNRGSGTYYHLVKEMERQGHIIERIGPIDFVLPLPTRILRGASIRLGKRYRTYQDIFVAYRIGQIVSERLRAIDFDVVLTNDYVVVGYTTSQHPLVLYTDAIIPLDFKENRHTGFNNLSPISAVFCQHVTRRGLARANHCIMASAWAFREVQANYIVDSRKLTFLPYGANLGAQLLESTSERSKQRALNKRSIDLLFVGKDWNRKGGDIAVQVVEELRSRDIEAHLHVVGPDKLPATSNTDYVTLYGYLDKQDPNQLNMLIQLYRECDVFIMPSLSEALGIVFLEAAAFGLPSLGYQIMGVPTAVKDGESGYLFPIKSTAVDFADRIQSWCQDYEKYLLLSDGARKHFEMHGNWTGVVKRLIGEFEKIQS